MTTTVRSLGAPRIRLTDVASVDEPVHVHTMSCHYAAIARASHCWLQ